MLKDLIVIGLWTLAMFFCILRRKQIDVFAYRVWVEFKDIFLKKNVPVVQGETEEQKQARFNSGVQAGNELYSEGNKDAMVQKL